MSAGLPQRLLGAGYAAGWAAVRALPDRPVARAFSLGADLAWSRHGKGVRRLAGNLRRVLGPEATEEEVAATTRAAVQSYARYWREVFRLPVIPPQDLLERTDMVGDDRMREPLAAGRGVIVALPHMGNWDAAGAWSVSAGLPFTTVAERLEPASLFDRFVGFRETLGMEVLPLTGGERPPFDILAERLDAGRMLCLMADRDLTAGGVDVSFFGATARMPAGPAALAARTGAALLPATLWFTDDDGREGWSIRIFPEVRPPATIDERQRVAVMTQELADVFAAGIAAHPADWHMLQRLWLDDLDPHDSRRRPGVGVDAATPGDPA